MQVSLQLVHQNPHEHMLSLRLLNLFDGNSYLGIALGGFKGVQRHCATERGVDIDRR